MTSDLIRELGPLAFASRLKRLSERLMQDVSSVYSEFDTDFEARWFALAYLLNRQSPMAVTEVAGILGYTHPAVVQIAAAMERRGLLRSRNDAGDGRRRLLSLTAKGKATVKRIAPVWDAVRQCTQEVITATGHDVLSVLESIEQQLDQQELLPRLRRELRTQTAPVTIVPFTKSLAPHFARLNREWLGRDFPLEPHDRLLLSNPAKEIIGRGGHIWFARSGREIVGTVALILHTPGSCEIAKMAVTSNRRGEGIGRRLAEEAIAWARRQNARDVLIATSPKLVPALSLYRSLGFVETTPDPEWRQQYRRRTIFMKLTESRVVTVQAKE